ncbi:MAG: IS200/IS605 family transposase [Acidobacteria bacterium]|nr:IS200/IS605 family transposase [Acidobacteriota bacterium]
MSQSLSSLIFHLVFSTKHRRRRISRELQPQLHKFIAGTLRSNQSKLLAAGGMPDHLHLLVSLARQMSVSVAVREIKSNSSRWIHESCPKLRRFAWQNGYSAFSVSFSQLEPVKQYIENQEQHHRKRTFREELLFLLKRHRVEYDQRYLWD